ncbi:hypothetical protein CRUP_028697 [Coryphaenoides rupestris]|nr:hypothetical protein CRUP_028697 [Coryphaenoides rupestris]
MVENKRRSSASQHPSPATKNGKNLQCPSRLLPHTYALWTDHNTATTATPPPPPPPSQPHTTNTTTLPPPPPPPPPPPL